MKISNLSFTKEIFKDIRFWIILFFVIRLYGITNPPLEVAHNWRQTTVTMAARNYYEVDNNILYPRIDFAGKKTGITGMEFPILNYSIYLVSEVFGYQHWYGRLINLIISSFGLFFFFKLIKKYFKKQIAFNATIILLFSIWFVYSRKIMPDTFSMSFILMSIYYGTNYFEEEDKRKRIINIILYMIFVAIGSLSKLPVAYLLIIFVFFIFNKEFSFKSKMFFIVASVLSVLYTAYWYFYWVPYLVDTFGFWHFFMGKSFVQGASEIFSDLNQTLYRFYDTAMKYIAFILFISGIIMSIIKKQKKIILILSVSFLAFLVIVFKAGFTFYHHTYYIIPFVPVMALVAANGLSFVKNKKLVFLILFAIAGEGIANQQHDFRIREKHQAILDLEKDLDIVSNNDDLILINSGDYPTPMYFSHRKGWINYNEKIKDPKYIQSLKVKGLKHIVILKRVFGREIKINFPVVLDNENYCIYSLSK